MDDFLRIHWNIDKKYVCNLIWYNLFLPTYGMENMWNSFKIQWNYSGH